MSRWWCEHAWLPAGVARGVLVEESAGRITAVLTDRDPDVDAVRLPGLVLPGFANVHSHAFHRALRGRTQHGSGDFWTWREQMYAVAECLDLETYAALARATFAEMALAGITCVGEFHYMHHRPDGTPYDDPNAIGRALARAAAGVGIRITLLDTCYLAGGFGHPLDGAQLRYGDGDAQRWAARVDELLDIETSEVRVGAAIHSVRAVPRDQLPTVARWAQTHERPLHVHLSEQPAENDACLAAHGCTPTRLLAEAGALAERTVAVHAAHLTDDDVAQLAASGTGVCLCPTTERDLADGIGPAGALADAGVALSLGSDSHAVIDPFEEARAVELDERLATGRRGRFRAAELLEAATSAGHRALGWPDAGQLAVGMRADLVAVDLRSVRTAGAPAELETVVFAATAADVTDVVVDGRLVVHNRRHLSVDVAAELRSAIAAVTTAS